MEDEKLRATLRSVGMGFFVEFYSQLADESVASHNIIISLEKMNRYTSSTRSSRVSSARTIIRSGLGVEALKLVTEATSKRITNDTRLKARQLIWGIESDK